MTTSCAIQPCASSTNYAQNAEILWGAAVNIFLTAQCVATELSLQNCLPIPKWPEDKSDDLSDSTFDFIIVGAGTAGSVVANRLSEISRWKILLIEAGDDPPFLSSIPALFGAVQNTQYDWQYRSENDNRICKGFVGGQCVIPRGKMLGGTSNLNGMIYVRGSPLDYDDIAASGNPGWQYSEVLKYFIKSENLTHPRVENDETLRAFHGYDGECDVEPFSSYGTQEFVEILMKAYEEIGSPTVVDVNGRNQFGTVRVPAAVRDGLRESSASAFLAPIAKRPNLIVWKNALATKILFDDDTATGVQVLLKDNTKVQVTARKEVIISGGAINTPQLLMLSGLGPSDHLNEMEIPIIADLPVGENLYDHVFVPSIIGFQNGGPSLSLAASAAEYVSNRTGIFAQIGAAEVITNINTKGESDRPDVQLTQFYTDAGRDIATTLTFGYYFAYNQRIAKSIVAQNSQMHILLTLHILLNEKSRGRILLKNINPKAHPRIHLNYLSDSTDVETLLNSIDYTTDLINTESFRRLNATLLPFDIPECNLLKFPSRSYWKCVMFHLGQSTWHLLGTAKMGHRQDPTAVVDARLRVHKTKNLRVVDGSVIPSPISGNVNAPIMMFAENVSHMIKEDHLSRIRCV